MQRAAQRIGDPYWEPRLSSSSFCTSRVRDACLPKLSRGNDIIGGTPSKRLSIVSFHIRDMMRVFGITQALGDNSNILLKQKDGATSVNPGGPVHNGHLGAREDQFLSAGTAFRLPRIEDKTAIGGRASR